MKKTTMKLLLTALMLGMPSLQGAVHAELIQDITENGGASEGIESGMCSNDETGINHDNKEEEFPRRMPAHYSHLANAYWNKATSFLSVNFFTSSTQAVISVYKEDALVKETTCQISTGDTIELDLSMYGNGDYQLVITGVGRRTLYGHFNQ